MFSDEHTPKYMRLFKYLLNKRPEIVLHQSVSVTKENTREEL